MDDILEIFDKLTDGQNDINIFLVIILCIITVIAWKTLDLILPSFLDGFINKKKETWSKRKRFAHTDQNIRDFISRYLSNNWISSVPSLSNYNFAAPLEKIFVPVYLDIGYRKGLCVSDVISASNTILLVGQPGSGKSTLISMLAMAYAKDQTELRFGFLESRLPLFLELKKLKDDIPMLPQAFSEYFSEIGLNVEHDFLSEQLENGRCSIFLDGLDECGDYLRRSIVVDWIIKMNSVYGLNRWIISSRNTSNDILKIPNTPKAEINIFSIEQIRVLLSKWLALEGDLDADHKINDELITSIFDSNDYLSLQPFLYNPLMITLIAILYKEGYNIPKNRARIIHLFIKIVAKEWDGIKLIDSRLIQIRIGIMSKIALFIMSSQKSDKSIDLNTDEANDFSNNLLTRYKLSSIKNFIDYVVDRTGLMRKTAESKYEFVNRNFLEYLAALEITRSENFNNYINLIQDDYWLNTLEFCASIHRDPISLLNNLESCCDYKNVSYCRVLSNLFLENDCLEEKELKEQIYKKIGASISHLLETGFRDRLAIKMAYLVLGKALIKELKHEASIPESKISTETIAWCFVSIDSDFSTKTYLQIVHNARGSGKYNVLFSALGEIRSSLSTTFLLKSIESTDPLEVDKAIKTLVSQGELMVPYCKSIIEDTLKPKQYRLKMIVALAMLGYSHHLPYIIDKLNQFSLKDQLSIKEALVGTTLDFYFLQAVIEKFFKSKNIYIKKFKPILDKILASFLLLLAFPALIVVPIIIYLESGAPIMYRQIRMGYNGKIFSIKKFRTMRFDVEKNGAIWADKNDSRITRIGAFLRKTRLDEIPQIISVLEGHMSLVGPRPERPEFCEPLNKEIPFYEERLNVKPGITGLAQLMYPYGSSVKDASHKLYYDIMYISKCSFFLDLKILLDTFMTSMAGRGSR